MLLLPLLTGRGHVGRCGSLRCVSVCSLLQACQRCCNSFMYHRWLQCCKCSKKWIDQGALAPRPEYSVSKASTVAMREAQPSSAGSVQLR